MHMKSLFSKDGQTWSSLVSGRDAARSDVPLDWAGDRAVAKIVVGTPPAGDAYERGKSDLCTLLSAIPADLSRRYPALTHLYLWQVDNLFALPELPQGLQCLDVRGCPQLTSLCNLPEGLQTLVLEDCPSLRVDAWQGPPNLPALRELSFQGCTGLAESWLRQVLARALQLRTFDASRCTQLRRITELPVSLVDLRLNGCSELESVPIRWPVGLVRLELRDAHKLRSLPDFPDTVDYLDLVRTRRLQCLPAKRGAPRTLLLYGSGVLEPPATEHGADDRQNVAVDVQAYFAAVTLTGPGQARGCKLLILGNGSAGKTCLAMHLAGQDYQQWKAAQEQQGREVSTHGVQFRNLPEFQAEWDGQRQNVPLHLWDFGGQEIYHNTHRLFISRGTVFVLVWNPDEVPQDAAARQASRDRSDYVDQPRPLQYWIDLIRRSCDHMPSIVIVCSRRSSQTPELEEQWRQAVREDDQQFCQCLYVDSWNRTGQTVELWDWLAVEVGKVIATQGHVVPMHWQLAQELVEGWTSRCTTDPEFAKQYRALSIREFSRQLRDHLAAEIQTHRAELTLLAGALQQQMLTLDETSPELLRTLGFLTRIGSLYWDPDLFDDRVIISQQWALEGLYTVLDRSRSGPIFSFLMDRDGAFTASDLHERVWHGKFTADEQQLLISFMVRCGLCFQRHSAETAWREEPVYVSLEHLPTSREARLQHQFDGGPHGSLSAVEETLSSRWLHQLDWQVYLMDAARQYGANAAYAKDGILFSTERQSVLITCHIDRQQGFGGEITVQVAGTDAQELCRKLTAEWRQRLPDAQRPGQKQSQPLEAVPQAVPRPSVFISYAWNAPSTPETDYEGLVNQIEQLLLKQGYEIGFSHSLHEDHAELVSKSPTHANGNGGAGVVLRDKRSIRQGDSLVTFMQTGARSHRVILVHSDRYWLSINCMYEMFLLRNELAKPGKSLETTVIPIELGSSGIRDSNKYPAYIAEWERRKQQKASVPARMIEVNWSIDRAATEATSLIHYAANQLSDREGINLKASSGHEQVLQQLQQRLQPVEKRGDV